MGAIIGLIAAALHRQHEAENLAIRTGAPMPYSPRIVDKTTYNDGVPPDSEKDWAVAHVQPNEVRDTYIFFWPGFRFSGVLS